MAGSAKAAGTAEYSMSGKTTLATVTWRIMLTAIDVSVSGHFCESVCQSGERLKLRGRLQVLRSKVSTCLYDSSCLGCCKDSEVANEGYYYQ